MNSDGTLNEIGEDAVRQSSVTSASEMLRRAKDFNNQDEMNSNARGVVANVYEGVYNDAYNKAIKDGKSDSQAKSMATKTASNVSSEVAKELSSDGNYQVNNGMLNDDFKAKTGDSMAQLVGEGAGRRYTEKLDGATIAGVSIAMKQGQAQITKSNGAKFDGSVSSDIGTNKNSLDQTTKGTKTTNNSGTDYNIGSHENIEAILANSGYTKGSKEFNNTMQNLAYLQDIGKQVGNNKIFSGAVLAAANGGKEELNKYIANAIKKDEKGDTTLSLDGMMETAEQIAEEYGVAGAGMVATYEAGQIAYNKAKGNFVDTKTGKTVKAGDLVNIKGDDGKYTTQEVTKSDLESSDRFQKKFGKITDKVVSAGKKTVQAVKKFREGDSAFSDFTDNSVQETDNPDSDSTKNSSTNETQSLDSQKDSFHKDSSNKDNPIISENGEKSKEKVAKSTTNKGKTNPKDYTNEQKSVSNWIDKQQSSLNLDNDKDLAKYKALEDLRGANIDEVENLDSIKRNQVGLGHNSEMSIKKVSDAMDSSKLYKAGAKALPGPLKLLAVGMAAATVANAQDEFSQGNYAKSLFTATSLLDPTGASDMVVASMDAREKLQEATRGRTLSSGTTQGLGEQIMSSPFMQQISSLFSSEQAPQTVNNTQQAIQQDMANGSLQSYISQQANSFIPTNTEALQAQTSVMQLNSLAGPVSFGQTNSRMLRVNGAATQIPYNQFQNSMQTNPMMAQNFAQNISASDMNGISPTALQGIQDMPTLLSEINQRSSFQEFQAMSSSRSVNSVMSMADEQLSMMEDLEDAIENLRE